MIEMGYPINTKYSLTSIGELLNLVDRTTNQSLKVFPNPSLKSNGTYDKSLNKLYLFNVLKRALFY